MKLTNNFMFNIHYSFYILFILSLFTGNIIPFVILEISILAHEFFHILCALIFKLKVSSLELFCIGSVADIKITNINPIKKLIVYISGVIFNLIVIILIYFKAIVLSVNDLILNINILLIIFNLLESILEMIYKEKYKISINYSSYISVIFLILFMCFAIYFQSICLFIVFLYLAFKNILYIISYLLSVLIRLWQKVKI